MSDGLNSTPATQQKSSEPKVEYISASAESADSAESQTKTEEIVVQDWDATMQDIANQSTKRLTVPRNSSVSRTQVVGAFVNAFELIGGVPRLALWAHSNPTEFYKLYSRLLPSQASSALGETNELTIRHILPRTALDD